MLAYDGSAKRICKAQAFASDAQGLTDFEQYLQSTPRRPVRLMVDLIDEVFRVDSMPRVFGSDRKALRQRLLARHFRTTACRHLIIQGRHRTGRRDLRVLICGLTNPEPVKTWVDIISRNHVPLAGIHSLSLIGERLLPCLQAAVSQALLITQQSPEMMRESFYDHGHLRFSRSIAIRCQDTGTYAGFVDREVRNTLRFLQSQRLLRQSERLHVHLIARTERRDELRQGLRSDETIAYRTWDQVSVGKRLRIRGELPSEFADGLFVHLLSRQRWPINHYATPDMRTHAFHRHANGGLYAASLAILLAAITVGAVKLIEGRLYAGYRQVARLEAARYQRAYDELLREISAFPLQAAHIKDVVDLVRELDASINTTPAALMVHVGEVLNHHPSITVREMRWIADSNAQASSYKQAQGERTQRDDRFVTGERYQIALISGQVVDFGHSYRGAVSRFNAFVRALRSADRFSVVAVQRTPFDIDPRAAVSGDSGVGASTSNREQASYQLLLRMKRHDEDA